MLIVSGSGQVTFADYLDIYDKGAEYIRTTMMKTAENPGLFSEFVIG